MIEQAELNRAFLQDMASRAELFWKHGEPSRTELFAQKLNQNQAEPSFGSETHHYLEAYLEFWLDLWYPQSINREMNGHAHGNSKRPERILNGHTNTRTSRCLLFLFFSSNFNFSFLLIFLFIFFLLISSFVSVLLCLYNKFLQMAASKMVASKMVASIYCTRANNWRSLLLKILFWAPTPLSGTFK